MDKFLLTITNLASLPAIYASIQLGYFSKAIWLTLTTISSMVHHSAEKRFYGPTLIHTSEFTQFILLQFDRFFAVMNMLVVGSPEFVMDYYYKIIFLFGLMIVSDLVCYLPINLPTKRFLRLITHCPWHIGAFYMAYIAITKYETSKTFIEYFYNRKDEHSLSWM